MLIDVISIINIHLWAKWQIDEKRIEFDLLCESQCTFELTRIKCLIFFRTENERENSNYICAGSKPDFTQIFIFDLNIRNCSDFVILVSFVRLVV